MIKLFSRTAVGRQLRETFATAEGAARRFIRKRCDGYASPPSSGLPWRCDPLTNSERRRNR